MTYAPSTETYAFDLNYVYSDEVEKAACKELKDRLDSAVAADKVIVRFWFERYEREGIRKMVIRAHVTEKGSLQ